MNQGANNMNQPSAGNDSNRVKTYTLPDGSYEVRVIATQKPVGRFDSLYLARRSVHRINANLASERNEQTKLWQQTQSFGTAGW